MEDPLAHPARCEGYMLLFHRMDWDAQCPPEEAQRLIDDIHRWFDNLEQEGKLKGGHPLTEQRIVIRREGSQTVTDGPFAESKEAVGGFIVLDVASMDEAVAIARTMPVVRYGLKVEVREVAESCPVYMRMRRHAVTPA